MEGMRGLRCFISASFTYSKISYQTPVYVCASAVLCGGHQWVNKVWIMGHKNEAPCVCVCVCVCTCVQLLSCVQLFAISWTVVHQAPLFMEFSRQECWRG